MRQITLGAVAALLLIGASTSGQAGPVYKDRERFDGALLPPPPGPIEETVASSPARRLNKGPGYVGSDYGLGKPSFTGLGSRPDWGRSSE